MATASTEPITEEALIRFDVEQSSKWLDELDENIGLLIRFRKELAEIVKDRTAGGTGVRAERQMRAH